MKTSVRYHYRKRPKTGGYGEVRHHYRHLHDGRHELVAVHDGHRYVEMNLAELIAEHKRLIHVLKYGMEAEEKREATRQEKELRAYLRARHSFHRTGHHSSLTTAQRNALPRSAFEAKVVAWGKKKGAATAAWWARHKAKKRLQAEQARRERTFGVGVGKKEEQKKEEKKSGEGLFG